MLIKNGLVYDSQKFSFERKDINIENGKIVDFDVDDGNVLDACGAYIVPALIDVHTHGRARFDFIYATDEQLHIMARSYAKAGVLSVMPTIASAPLEDMLAAVERINKFVPGDDEADFVGVHMEGRYLNPAKKGAHSEELLQPLNASELDNKALLDCRALHISAALELDDGSFLKKAKDIGATVGLGHTNATYKEARRAEELGITSYTHLYNCMPTLHHRDGGAVCSALLGDAYVELICDGIHISPEMIRLAYKCKGSDKVTLVSDSMEATGCSDGDYTIAGNTVVVKDGVARTEGGALAGSTLSLFDAVKNLSEFCMIDFAKALPCATVNPAKQIGVFDRYGSIDVGKNADLIIINDIDSPNIDGLVIRGRLIVGGVDE